MNNRWRWWLHRKLQMSILLSREDITPVALLSTNHNVSSGRYLRASLRQRRITVENTIELISIESIKRCVAANIGVSYLPRFAVVKELKCGELIELPLANSRRPLRQCALTMPEKRLARRCTLLFSVLKSVFAGIKTMPGLNPALRLLFCRLRWHARSAWFTALTNIFSVAMAFFTRGFSFSLAFSSRHV